MATEQEERQTALAREQEERNHERRARVVVWDPASPQHEPKVALQGRWYRISAADNSEVDPEGHAFAVEFPDTGQAMQIFLDSTLAGPGNPVLTFVELSAYELELFRTAKPNEEE
jgi:hypothetical protein